MLHAKPLIARPALLAAPLGAALVGLSAFSAPADEVSFGPAEGARVTKVFSNTTELAMDDMNMVVNGEDMSEAAPQMDISTTVSMKITDTYGASSDGRPVRVERTFDELSTEGEVSAESMMGAMETELTGGSELEGTSVVFVWDEEAEEYDVVFDDGEDADEELLEDLDEDMDLRLFLPDGTVAEGDSWRVDNELLGTLLTPGGDLKILPDDVEGMDMGMGMGGGGGSPSDMAQMLGEVEGSILATYEGRRDVDGVSVGVIKITIDVNASNDITDILQEATEEMETPEGFGDMEVSYDYADAEFELEGKGELLWNLDAGHLHAFELEGDLAMAMDMGMAMSMMGQDMEMEMSMEMSGTIAYGARTESE